MADHPTKDELSGFVLGTLPPDSTEAVAGHVEHCPPCQETIHELDAHKDTLLKYLREPPPPPVEGECRQAVEKAAAIARVKPPAPADTVSTPSLVQPSKEPAKERVFGEYVILEKIGAGGMGQVFKARHRSMDRIVALKVLAKSALNSPEAVQRFQREVKAAAKLIHPNIVIAHDAGQQQGLHFLVMEFVEGSDLANLVKKQGPLPVDKAVDYVLQAARGLEFAHKKGVVHRDIKPANLLLDADGTVKILDMGLARFDDAMGGGAGIQDGLTQSGQVMGTVDYMAPEQAVDTRTADAKADVYALGCTLHRLLIGENVYTGETLVQKLLAHREQPIPSLTAKRPDVPPSLDDVFRRMVAKRPEERLASMREVVEALDAVQKGLGDSGQGSGPSITIDIQPRPQFAASRATRFAPLAGIASDGKKPPRRKFVAAAAGFLFLALGVWLIVRDKDGKEIARVNMPAGATIAVETTEAKSANDLNSQISNPTSPPPSGNYALELADSSVELPVAIENRAPRTIELTIIPKRKSSSDPMTLFQWGHLGIEATAGEPRLRGTWQVLDSRLFTNEVPFVADQRMSLAIVFDRARATIYFDGKKVGSGTTGVRSSRENDLFKTAILFASANFPCVIDELRLSRESRYVIDYVPSARLEPDADTLALYHFDEGVGDVLVDSSGNNHHGKILGAKWVRADGSPVGVPPSGGIAPAQTSGPAQAGTPTPPLAVAPFDAAAARAHQEAWAKHLGTTVETTNSVGMKMILIPPGEFLMGSTDEQVEAALKAANEVEADSKVIDRITNVERPQHKVVISKPLLMSATEVTIEQFKKFVAATKYVTIAEKSEAAAKAVPTGPNDPPPTPIRTYLNPGYAVTDDSPAAAITWNDAVAYCKWLSDQETRTYRLPTEAEWEYACRAGTTTQYSFGDDYNELPKYGWHNKSAGDKSHPVGALLPNNFGLFDMHGNLYEWCGDFFDEKWYAASTPNDPNGPSAGPCRVLRGGCWYGNASPCRSASRYNLISSYRFGPSGFRCVLEVNVPAVAAAARSTGLNIPSAEPEASATGASGVAPVEVPPSGENGSATGATPPPAASPFDAQQARAYQEAWAKYLGVPIESTNFVGATMVLIPPGEFLMGSTNEQVDEAIATANAIHADEKTISPRIESAERPQHKVVISKPFQIGATEVTVMQFRRFVEATNYVTESELPADDGSLSPKTWRSPGYGLHDDAPVEQISWNDANAYCNWLSDVEDGTYRLPTEAEWEYACRAGTTTQFSFGDDWTQASKYAWFTADNTPKSTRLAGQKAANPFGLFDMHGSVREWCHDWHDNKWYERSPSIDPQGPDSGTHRVLRGGAWFLHASFMRSASRNESAAKPRYSNAGFRLVCEVSPRDAPSKPG